MYLTNMNVIRNFLIFLCFYLFFSVNPLSAQKTKKQLEREKIENLRKIGEARKILLQTEKQKEVTIGQLNALIRQISVRRDLIDAIRQEISLINRDIKETNEIINSLENDLDKLKKEYASMVYTTYKANRGYSKLAFLFAAESFNQFLMRLKYMEQYSDERKNQAKEIKMVTEALVIQIDELRGKKEEKDQLLREQLSENRNLVNLQNKQKSVINSLSKKENKLKNELAERREANEQLEKMIAEIVREEIRRTSKGTSDNRIALTPEAARLSASFEENHSRLPWPVESGFISRGFGEQPHPVLKRVKYNNKGVDIQTNSGEIVRAVFEGIVTAVLSVPGMNRVVLIRHGEFLTVYGNLIEVNVQNGQAIKTKDIIGKVYTDRDGISEVHFELWKNKITLNPQRWLSRK